MNIKSLNLNLLKESFKRFPLSSLSAFIMAIAMIFVIEVENSDFEYLEEFLKVIITASLGIFMFTSFRLFGDKNPLCLVGIVALVGYYLILDQVKEPSSILFERHLFLSVMFFITIFWAPFWRKNPTNEEFWDHANRVIFAFVTAVLFSIILYAGLSGALYAVDSLFSLDLNGKRYGQLVFLIIGLFSVNYFLSQIPKDDTLKHHSYTKVEIILTKYILTPLTIGYFFILYLYSAKILFSWSLPTGGLAWIIVAFSIIAIITYLFWTPLWSDKTSRYKRLLFLALLPQTIMLFIAVWTRIEAYSWSEHRYMVLVFGVWLFGVSLYFLLFKNAKYKWMFIALSALLLFSQVSPINAYSVGKNAQIKRLDLLLSEHKNLSDKSDMNTRYAISSTIEYLYRGFGIEPLRGVMPKIVSEYEESEKEKKEKDKFYYGNDFPYFATEKLGFHYVNRWEMLAAKEGHPISPPSIYNPDNSAVLNVKGYDWMLNLHFSIYEDIAQDKIADINTTFDLNDENITIKENNSTIKVVSISAFLQKALLDESLIVRRFQPNMELEEKKLNFFYEDDDISLKVIFLNISSDFNGTISDIFAKALYKRK